MCGEPIGQVYEDVKERQDRHLDNRSNTINSSQAIHVCTRGIETWGVALSTPLTYTWNSTIWPTLQPQRLSVTMLKNAGYSITGLNLEQ